MIRKILFSFLLFCCFTAKAQFNNSWIDYSKTYFKFKVSADSLYRIPQSAFAAAGLAGTNADHFQLWRNGEQVRLYTSVSGAVLGSSDYVEFWGEMNDGKADKSLYRKPEFQLADKYSLETDTATYFLTVNPSGANFRYLPAANAAPGAAVPDAYFMRREEVNYRSLLNFGFGQDFEEYVYSAAYDDGEGYTSGELTFTNSNPVASYTENIAGLNVYAAGPANSFSLRAKLFFNTQNSYRRASIKVFNTEVFNEESSGVKSTIVDLPNLPLSYLQNTSNAPITFVNEDPSPPHPVNDRMVIAGVNITYPATFNFNNQRTFYFELAASATGNYLQISNFNFGTQPPVLYDMTAGKRYVGDVTSIPGKINFVLPASPEAIRKFRLVNEESGNIRTVAALTQKTFVNYNTAATRGDFIIISNPKLYNDGAGVNNVDLYKQYRSSANGGSYNAQVYDINELADQFAFGIRKHPEAVRNFVLFMNSVYPVKPKFILLIGRGLTYQDYKKNATNPVVESLDFVPTFGWPASDNLIVSTPGTVVPVTPVGRLAVINGAEIGNYLQKIKEYEQAQKFMSPLIADKAWMKNGVNIIGGKTDDESSLFRYYMGAYQDILQDTLYGAKIENFQKTSNSTVQQISSNRITQLFEEGLGYVGYFGHSSATTFEFNISNPLAYNSTGKYPFFNVSGCSAGNFYNFDISRLSGNQSLSESYTLAKQKGSIGFLADTHFGLPTELNEFNGDLFQKISSTMYGQSLGKQIQAVLSSLGGANPNLYYVLRLHLEEINLHGDPSLKLNNFPKPDYVIEEQSVKITPDIISVADANFTVKVTMRNIGRATLDSIKVSIKRLRPNTSVPVVLFDQMIAAPKNIDSISIVVPVNPLTDKGQNDIIVELDNTFKVDELYETNNKITKSFAIFEDELRPVYPYNYAIVNSQNITFSASTANPLVSSRNYVMEIDTTQLFNSPFKKTYNTNGTGGVIQFTPSNITFSDSTVYYWRTAVVPAAGNIIWNGMSFTYLANSTPGFDQSHFYQYQKNNYNNIVLDNDRLLKFTPTLIEYSVLHAIFPAAPGASDYSLQLGGNFVQQGFYSPFSANSEVLRFYIIDSATSLPWYCTIDPATGGGTYGSVAPIPLNVFTTPGFFHFKVTTKAERDNVVNFLNLIPAGNTIVLLNAPVQPFTHFPAEWATDGTVNLYTKLKAMGFSSLDQLTTNLTFIFITKKGTNTAIVQQFGSSINEKLIVPFSVTSKNIRGSITSDVFGPAAKWNALHWRGSSLENPTTDVGKIQILGVRNSGVTDTLALVSPVQDTSLSWINTQLYPNLKLRMINEDTTKATPLQLRYWRVNADMLPEGAVAPNILYSMKDTVEVGELINFSVAFKNISPTKFDSLIKVRFRITDNNNFTNDINIPARKALVSNDTLIVSYTIDTKNYTGKNTLFVEFNPANHQPEQFHFNNLLYKSFYVKGDKFNPLLDVTFDGVHILNNDIVAAKPNILIKLKDENRFLALKDTSLINVQIVYPGGRTRTFYFNSDTIRFIPANLASGDNTASIELKPFLTEDGDYELLVSGRDAVGNEAGALNFHSRFTVINKPMISELLNYPNPFTTSTAFVFTLTGSQVPQNMRIQILTITGKVVREITKDELGAIHVGRNITDFKWDGTDMYGQKLANGVYIYRVLTNLNGKSLDKYKADGDDTEKYFNKGYGKMYLMR